MDENNNNDLPDNVVPLFPDEMPPMQDMDGQELNEWVWTNDFRNPMPRQLVRMLYYSAFENKLGVMHAKYLPDGKIHTLIVGVDTTPDGAAHAWPIAKILTEDEQDMYLAPDGQGNFIGEEDDGGNGDGVETEYND